MTPNPPVTRRLVDALTPAQFVAAIAAVAALVYLAVLFLPRRAAIAALAQQRDQLEAAAAIQSAALARLEEAPAFAVSESRAAALRGAVPDVDAVAPLLAELTQQLRAVGMSVEQIKRRPDKAEGNYVSLSFSVDGRGTYAQLTAFLAALERMSRLVDVVGLTLRAHAPSSAAGNVIDASCELRAYRFVDQQPSLRPSLAAEAVGESR